MADSQKFTVDIGPDDVRITDSGGVEVVNTRLAELLRRPIGPIGSEEQRLVINIFKCGKTEEAAQASTK